MKAIQVTRFGGPETLALVDLPDPAPAPGEVAIDVSHAAVGLIDVFFRKGHFKEVPGLPQPPFVPGLEVAGAIRQLGEGVTGFEIGETVITFSVDGTGGYASVVVSSQELVVSTKGYKIDPALAAAMVPNATMAQLALANVAHMRKGERILVHGALGGFAAAFPGIARELGASRVVGTVRASKLAAAADTKLPYDDVVDSAELLAVLGDEKFDIIVDPVGGAVRTQSLQLLAPGGRLVVAGNAAGEWTHQIDSTQIWMGGLTVSGFNAGAYIPAHLDELPAAARAALKAVAAGLGESEVEVLAFADAVTAHTRMESRDLNGRIVLAP